MTVVPTAGLVALVAAALLSAAAVAGQAPEPPNPGLPDDEWLGFVEIPAGPFVMGTDRGRDPLAFDNERWSSTEADGTVQVSTFFLGRSEVTIAQYAAFVRSTGFRVDPRALSGPPNHPVAFVSWPDALAYCRWLEATLRDWPRTPPRLAQLLRDGWHVTLPTEAEWEKAARGADRRRYPWGNEPRPDRSTYAGTGTTAVGHFPCPECPFPVFDTSGNVSEWTRSPYQPYPYNPDDDRANLEADALWVIRGGHFADTARYVRTTARGAAEPGARRAFIGFRTAMARPGRPDTPDYLAFGR